MTSPAPGAESDLGPMHSAARDCAPACGGPALGGPGDQCGFVSHERGGDTSATGTGRKTDTGAKGHAPSLPLRGKRSGRNCHPVLPSIPTLIPGTGQSGLPHLLGIRCLRGFLLSSILDDSSGL